MLSKQILRLMAESERMMDEGKIPFVMAPSPNGIMERLAMTDELMEDFGLKQGQSINSMIRDAILNANIKKIADILSAAEDEFIEEELENNFDFRKLMDEGDEDATKH